MSRTRDTFAVTNAALLAGDFITARTGLEQLARDPSHVDLFCAPESYLGSFPELQRQPLMDRLQAADATARRNAQRVFQ